MELVILICLICCLGMNWLDVSCLNLELCYVCCVLWVWRGLVFMLIVYADGGIICALFYLDL